MRFGGAVDGDGDGDGVAKESGAPEGTVRARRGGLAVGQGASRPGRAYSPVADRWGRCFLPAPFLLAPH